MYEGNIINEQIEQSFGLYVDEIEEYQFKHQEQEDLSSSDHSIDQI